MTPTRKRRLIGVMVIVLGVASAAAIALTVLNDNMLFYTHPSEILAGDWPANRQLRLGGFVKLGSVEREEGTLRTRFDVTDCRATITVVFEGILPDLFQEGEAVIAPGRLRNDGVFEAVDVMAKHDENYMPPEVAETVQKIGPDCASAGVGNAG